jgi:signal recognition particle subunit SRP54
MGGGGESPESAKMRTLSPKERNAKKAQRKRERDARKKGRK